MAVVNVALIAHGVVRVCAVSLRPMMRGDVHTQAGSGSQRDVDLATVLPEATSGYTLGMPARSLSRIWCTYLKRNSAIYFTQARAKAAEVTKATAQPELLFRQATAASRRVPCGLRAKARQKDAMTATAPQTATAPMVKARVRALRRASWEPGQIAVCCPHRSRTSSRRGMPIAPDAMALSIARLEYRLGILGKFSSKKRPTVISRFSLGDW
mmetsp:Transcript_17658/g.49382  ORF Transcript_17658/g.49382 Transcript_17658/m.49382 type:complete len:212 (-) Transcript_17658:1368-2003(-)